MPNLPRSGVKYPWMKSNIKEGKRQTEKENEFYHTSQWRKIREYVLKREPLCRQCMKDKRIRAANIVDHIIPVSKGGSIYDTRNLQPLCDSCHARKSGKEAHE